MKYFLDKNSLDEPLKTNLNNIIFNIINIKPKAGNHFNSVFSVLFELKDVGLIDKMLDFIIDNKFCVNKDFFHVRSAENGNNFLCQALLGDFNKLLDGQRIDKIINIFNQSSQGFSQALLKENNQDKNFIRLLAENGNYKLLKFLKDKEQIKDVGLYIVEVILCGAWRISNTTIGICLNKFLNDLNEDIKSGEVSGKKIQEIADILGLINDQSVHLCKIKQELSNFNKYIRSIDFKGLRIIDEGQDAENENANNSGATQIEDIDEDEITEIPRENATSAEESVSREKYIDPQKFKADLIDKIADKITEISPKSRVAISNSRCGVAVGGNVGGVKK